MSTELSEKGKQLIRMYEQMADEGYSRVDGGVVSEVDAFSDFESRVLREDLRELFKQHHIKSVLDYGCGGSDWSREGFDPTTGESASEYYNLDRALRYEPARGLDEREVCDAVLSFDVLEHVFISDVPTVVRDHFQYAKKLLVVNVACYKAAAILPDGTNAHVTVRPPIWWKGIFDAIAPEFPDVSVLLIASVSWRKFSALPLFSDRDRQEKDGFIVSD